MVQKLKKTCLLVGSLLACYGLAYSEDSPNVVSQGGPLGATSIGDQNLGSVKAGGSSANANATNSQNSAINERQLLLKLQEQVQQLQGQLQQLKSQGSNFKNTSNGDSQFTTYSSKVDGNTNARSLGASTPSGDMSEALISGASSSDIMANVNSSDSIINLDGQALGGIFNQRGGIDVGGAPAITTQGEITYLGAYSGNNSIPIGQISSSLFASTLLGQREKFDDYTVFFGGKIEADAQVWFGNTIQRNGGADPFQGNGQNIYLTSANLYFLSNLGHYVTAQFDFDTDETGSFGLGNAFVIFGNLDTSPFFVTAGRNKLTVGSYGGGGAWANGITDYLSPGKVTNLSVNYKSEVWNYSVAVFGSDDKRANFSTGLFYADSWTPNLAAGFNVGYVYNMAGAGNSSLAAALDNLPGREKDTVGAFNVDGNLTYALLGGFLNVGAGWATTTNKEDFNGDGTSSVLTGAWYGAANYSLVLGGRNTNFGVSYGQSYNAAAVPMGLANASPSFGQTASGIRNQLIFSGQRAYFDDNVLFGPEYAYQKLYSGEHMNTITLDMSVYI